MPHAPANCTVPAKNPSLNENLTIIILSAGVGRRMKSRGTKSLLPVGHSNILEHQIKTLWKDFPSADIIVVTGFQGGRVRSAFRGVYPVRFVYNPHYETTNVMYSIALGLEASITKNTLILHGDILFSSSIVADMIGKTSKLLVLPHGGKAAEQEVGAAINNNCVTHLSYGLSRQWGQMAYFTGKEIALFEKIAFNHEASSNRFFYEGINEVIDIGGSFVVHSPTGSWIEVDSAEDLTNTKGIIL